MVYSLKDHLWARTAALAVACSSLWVTLHAASAQIANRSENRSLRRIGLIIHVADTGGNPVPLASLKEIEVTEHRQKLQLLEGPHTTGPNQVALLIDANFHQRDVLALEQQTALELLSEFEREKSQALVMSYGTEIRSAELTDTWPTLKEFVSSLRVETDKHNETVLLYDAMKSALEKLGDGPGTKALVVFAEGNDYGSSTGWRSVARLAQRNHVACYFVLFADHSFYGTKAVRHFGWDLVFEVAPKTGGRLWEVGNKPRKARETAQQISLAVDSQGLIEVLVPDVQVNRFHTIKVRCPGLRVIAQTGYFETDIQ